MIQLDDIFSNINIFFIIEWRKITKSFLFNRKDIKKKKRIFETFNELYSVPHVFVIIFYLNLISSFFNIFENVSRQVP